MRGYSFTESIEDEMMKAWFFSAIAASFNKCIQGTLRAPDAERYVTRECDGK
jgi:hypothetical protein